MRTLLLLLLSTSSLLAQSRFAIAPTYWFAYGNYAYQIHSIYDGSDTKMAGYSLASSAGLMAHYQFSQRWDLSVGALYNKGTSHLKTPQTDDLKLTSAYIQLPVFLNYRLSARRLSPYVSAGAVLEKEQSVSNGPIKPSAVVGIGLVYTISSRLSWLIQPSASYLFYKPASSPPYQLTNFTSYKIGLQTQLLLQF